MTQHYRCFGSHAIADSRQDFSSQNQGPTCCTGGKAKKHEVCETPGPGRQRVPLLRRCGGIRILARSKVSCSRSCALQQTLFHARGELEGSCHAVSGRPVCATQITVLHFLLQASQLRKSFQSLKQSIREGKRILSRSQEASINKLCEVYCFRPFTTIVMQQHGPVQRKTHSRTLQPRHDKLARPFRHTWEGSPGPCKRPMMIWVKQMRSQRPVLFTS